ncbi:response regulator transcription factor [Cytophagaceae bacterium DM2B3-1]|uniref:Response regulator transcription factor n=1 Tax=Xanthocytophaga flava TaxID=3048013 RepID=A0ABT7CIC6_9BACT|nr:response regulator transcription factor [Xanthocytophaga flavus]MDJ1493450.1 response regulator transcription factor [Xanthocytophaga flavus]
MSKLKILLVEDDNNLGELLKEYLDLKGYEARLARDGEEAFNLFRKETYDLCIFDVMMPKKDGFSLAKEVRSVDKQIPIIFLTAKSMKEDTLEGLRIGADDYMTKPFSMEELLLRMKAILRRSQSQTNSIEEKKTFEIGTYLFDYEQQLLKKEDKITKLTTKEAELLKLLCNNLNQTLERSLALRLIWRDDTYFNARSMDVYITKLRKYLKDDPQVEIINVHGTGYRLQVLGT